MKYILAIALLCLPAPVTAKGVCLKSQVSRAKVVHAPKTVTIRIVQRAIWWEPQIL